jgi:2-polyprenyl-3-methyl-5-hydroxy-6-metoxy-1,4-benzoquinol methylase
MAVLAKNSRYDPNNGGNSNSTLYHHSAFLSIRGREIKMIEPIVQIEKYSESFEDAIAEYCVGDSKDRGEKTKHELYLKVEYAKMFFDFCRRYFDIAGRRFVEIGCGTAGFSVGAALMGANVAATDFEEKAVNLARMRWQEHHLIGDLYQSDIRKDIEEKRIAAFDFVHCYQVIEHIPRADQFKALSNLFSMVAQGGYLFIDTENSLCPFDRHDTKTWLLRFLTKSTYEPLIEKLGKGLNFYEPSSAAFIQSHDYLSYDELIGAALISGFDVVSPFMPHGDKRQALRVLTGSDWLHDDVLRNIDVERFLPISLLLRKH